MNARNVIPSQHNYKPFDIDTRHGTVTLQRRGAFVYRAEMGGEGIGAVMVNRPGTEALYTAHDYGVTSWHRDTLEDCAEMLALAHLEATQ